MGNCLCHSSLNSWELQNTQDPVQVVLRRFLWSRLLHNILSSSAALGICRFSSEFLLVWSGTLLASAEGKPLFSQRCLSVEKGCVCYRDGTCPCTRVPGLGLGQVRFQELCQLPLEAVAGAGVWTSASTELGWRGGWVGDKNDWALTLAAC